MSYAFVRGRAGYGGYAGYNELPGDETPKLPSAQTYAANAKATASTLADESKKQAIEYARQQLENYPPAAAVLAEYDKYAGYLKSIPNFKLSDLKDPKKVEAMMVAALTAYAKANGIPTNTKEFEQYAVSVASSKLGVNIPPGWPTNVKDLKKAAVDLATTAVVMETGVDPAAITITVNALMDGKLSPSECEAIGTAAGAIAGAVIGQAFGIPAPIGAFIGGLIGHDIGGTLGQIFGAGPSGAEVVNAEVAAAKARATATLDQAKKLCANARSAYWQTFDKLLLQTELQWELAEVKIGWKFDLRWFGLETFTPLGQPFSHEWDASAKRFIGSETFAHRANIFSTNLVSTTYYDGTQGKDVTKYSSQKTYGCKFDYGCPYPVVAGLASPAGLERDAQAFLARGALWIPEAQRQYQCSYHLPTNLDDLFYPGAWIQSMQIDLQQEQTAVQALQILSVAVVGDLVKTAAAVAAEKGMYDTLKKTTLQLNQDALARGAALAQAQKTGRQLSDMVNYGMFALGVGLVGAALWKKRRA